MLDIEALRVAVGQQEIDTVVVAMTDMQGRLQGKRFHAQFFLDEVAEHGTEACAYLLAVDTEMNTVDGYDLASWENGYGDFVLEPDMATLRVLPWQPGTALVLADVTGAGLRRPGPGVAAPGAPRADWTGPRRSAGPRWPAPSWSSSSSRAATSRPGTRATGAWCPRTGTTRTTRCSAPAGSSRCCGTSGTRWRARACTVESAKGECNLGQHEIAFRYADALTTADHHVDLQDRREGDRGQSRVRAHVHGQAERGGRQLLPYPPVVPRRRGRLAGDGGRRALRAVAARGAR